MEVYFTVSLHGMFVFRTDIISNSVGDAARVERALWDAFGPLDGYSIERSERPSVWTTSPVKVAL